MKKKPTKKIGKKVNYELKPELATNDSNVIINKFTSVKHLANLGDIVAVMPALKKYYEVVGRKIKFLQMVNVPAAYYQGAVHPTKSDDGTQVTVNKGMFDMMKPLVESQEYIHSFDMYMGQHVDLDFDVIRGKVFVNMPNGAIQSWIMYAFPDLATDITAQWIFLPEIKNKKISDQVKGKIILNFTERYRNNITDYFFLQKYSPDLIFAGTEREHFLFCNRWMLNIPRLEIKDFLEYAYAIKWSRFTLGNQSLGWNLASALCTPRILEVCQYAPNCQPFMTDNSYGFFHQVGAEYYFRKLFNETN
jgi:hypothetical protein